jgi:hypothetical protein
MRPTSLIVNGNREMIIDAIDLQKGSGSKVNQAVALVLESVFNRSDLSASACGQFAEADGTSWDVVGSAPVRDPGKAPTIQFQLKRSARKFR